MTTPPADPPLSSAQRARSQEAQVATAEANARKAATDADTAALTLAQSKYKALVPDLTGVATSTVDDKSTGVAYSGLVTYSALNHAAEIVAARISKVLKSSEGGKKSTILVTSQSDLLTNELLSSAVATGLKQLTEFAQQVLALQPPRGTVDEQTSGGSGALTDEPRETVHEYLAGDFAALIAGGATASAAFGPIGLAAAAAAAIPSVISLFSSTITVKSHDEIITDLATTTSIVSALADRLTDHLVVHEDFRFAPATSVIRNDFQRLIEARTNLALRQERDQGTKNQADAMLSRAEQQEDEAKKASPEQPTDPVLLRQIRELTMASANAAARLSLISTAITSIDTFTTAANAAVAGSRSPLAIASLSESLHDNTDAGIRYLLSVKGLGGQSEEYTKDRHIGFDTYTTLADASISYLLYDTRVPAIIGSGVANGVSSVHGRLGQPPTGLVGPNADDAIRDQASYTQAPDAPPDSPKQHWWRRIFGGDP